jgi:hypothetical protein
MEPHRPSTLIVILLLVISLAATAAVAAGCGSGSDLNTSATVTVAPQTTDPADESATTSTVPGIGTFRSPFEQRTYLPDQPVDLSLVTNLDAAPLTQAQRIVLARQSFVGVVPPHEAQPWKFWQVYEDARYRGLPPFITADSILNAFHGVFDSLLQRMEEGALFGQLELMSETLYNAASEQWGEATDPDVKEAARMNMAYFAVANSLLKDGNAAPDAVGEEVDTELALIEAAEAPGMSPIFGYTEDYSQYKPRGHYTRSERLERYFKAMMWYGHTAFYINARGAAISPELADDLTRRATLISLSLVDQAKEAWSAIYEPTSFLVGRSDDIGVDEMRKVVAEVYGSTQPRLDDLADKGALDRLRAKLNELPAPRILTAPDREEGDTEDREEGERSFRVMGQRYIPDSYAFQQLVWAYVGDESNKRGMPMGLDIMAVLGSDQAYQLAADDYDQKRFKNWEAQLTKVHEEFSTLAPDLWPSNLYTGWLEALQHAMAPVPDGAPDFMKTQVWARKSLNTALGSWAELRHDTILYAKQSVVAEGDGGESTPEIGYVEPYPALYAKLGELALTLRKGLTDCGLLDSVSANKLGMMIELTDTLRSIADKQLKGGSLTADEVVALQTYGHTLEVLEQFAGAEQGETLSPTPEKSPLVADVHNDYNNKTILEEATGYPLILYAAFEMNGKTYLFAGASYSYYEFVVPLGSRLSDEEWTALLDIRRTPARPTWTNQWIVDK